MAYAERSSLSAGCGQTTKTQMDHPSTWVDPTYGTRSKLLRFHEHEVVFYEGDPADRFYEVVDGRVMLYKLLPDGRRQVVEVLGPGTLFGVTGNGIYDCNAETLTPVQVRSVERRDVEDSPAAQVHIARCLLSQLESAHDHAVLLGRKSAFERVATFLMRFVPQRGVVGCIGPQGDKDEQVVVLTMTRQEIADYLGLTIETVSRVISDLKRKGLVEIEKQDRLRITNVCGICQLTGAH